jgi:hypothetical protein
VALIDEFVDGKKQKGPSSDGPQCGTRVLDGSDLLLHVHACLPWARETMVVAMRAVRAADELHDAT